MRQRTIRGLRYALVLLGGLSLPAHANPEVEPLLAGVRTIARPGVPGSLCVFGPQAFAVVQDRQRNGAGSAVVAAAAFGRGRVVAFGHPGYLSAGALKQADTGRLLVNALHWSSRKLGAVRVAVIGFKGLDGYLAEQGVAVANATLQQLQDADAVIVNPWNLTPAQQSALREFVRQGGGLVTAGIGWGWQQLNPTKDLRTDYAANQLLAPMGLACGARLTSATTPEGYVTAPRPSPLTNISTAVAALQQRRESLKKEELALISLNLADAMRCLPPNDEIVLPQLRRLLAASQAHPYPTAARPLREQDVEARLSLMEEMRRLRKLPPAKVKAHPAAADFPGSVPADASRMSRTVTIDTGRPRWHSTGLYAPAGEVIRVRAPAAAAQAKLKVRIGAHSDTLWHKPTWTRVPAVTRKSALTGAETEAAGAFGGLVYIVVPPNCKLGAIDLTIEGAIEAPYFVRGKTDLGQWRQTVRRRPAPWAELATDKVILTTQAKYVRELDDPEALLEVWDKILDLEADLATIPRDRPYAQRIVLDRQISAGGLHAGYPIMGHLKWSAKSMVDREQLLTRGNWGFFHELGHNHQRPDWTFSGTGEVTCNLFSLYVQEKLCGITPTEDGRVGAEARKKRIAQFMQDGKKGPFTFLVMYVQMQEAFGWDSFKRVFAEYRSLPSSERPKTDQEKRDQWLIRYSRAVGRNLGPFLQAWKVDTSSKARAAVASLPVWMPPGFPPSGGG